MSVFQPVDVRAPASRRKQLVQRLMRQQAAQAPARSALMSVSGHPLGAPGSRMGGNTQGHGHNNVLAAILSKLGVQGPADADSGFGPHITPAGNDPYGSGHYVAPNEVASGEGQAIAAPTGPNGQPQPGFQQYQPGQYSGFAGINPDGSYFSDNMNMPGGDPSGYIPLGGGMYYDPVQNQVVGGNAHTGGAQI